MYNGILNVYLKTNSIYLCAYLSDITQSHSNTSRKEIVTELLPPLNSPVPSNWNTIDDDRFIMVWAMNVTHASTR